MEQLNPLLNRSLAYMSQQQSSVRQQLELINVDDGQAGKTRSTPAASSMMDSNQVNASCLISCNMITVMPAPQYYGGVLNVQEPSPLHSKPLELKKQDITGSLVVEEEEELGEEVAQELRQLIVMNTTDTDCISQQGFTTPPRSANRSHDFSSYTAFHHVTQSPLVCHENALCGNAAIAHHAGAQAQQSLTATEKESALSPSRIELHHSCINSVNASENFRSITGSCACMNERNCCRDYAYKLQPPPAPRKPKAKPGRNIQHRASFFVPADLELFFNSIYKLHANERS